MEEEEEKHPKRSPQNQAPGFDGGGTHARTPEQHPRAWEGGGSFMPEKVTPGHEPHSQMEEEQQGAPSTRGGRRAIPPGEMEEQQGKQASEVPPWMSNMKSPLARRRGTQIEDPNAKMEERPRLG